MFIDKELEKIMQDNKGIFERRNQKIQDMEKDVSTLETYLTLAEYDGNICEAIGGESHNGILIPYGYVVISDNKVCYQEKRGDQHKYFSALDNHTKLLVFPHLKALVSRLFNTMKIQIGEIDNHLKDDYR